MHLLLQHFRVQFQFHAFGDGVQALDCLRNDFFSIRLIPLPELDLRRESGMMSVNDMQIIRIDDLQCLGIAMQLFQRKLGN